MDNYFLRALKYSIWDEKEFFFGEKKVLLSKTVFLNN